MSQPLLSVSGLMMRFGGLLAVNNVSLELREREIVSLIGPNGAGKTTVFNCLTGFYKPTGGTILLRDQHLEGLPGQQIARMGVVRTFQHVRLFREMTVIENLLVAQHQQLKTGLFSGLLKTPAFRRAQSEALDRAATWLERIGLLEHANRQASNLAYGDQRRLEIARCMVTQPEILMLDEPAAGLNPKETKELDELIAELRNHHNTTILLIEHDMKLAMGGFFADRDQFQTRIKWVYELFPRLHERRIQRAGTMSGGEQQMLAIGRALMSQPRLLLLDEPSLGLAPIIIQQIFDTIEQLREQGMTIFLVEQNANQALKLADRGYVLENGHVVLEDTGDALLANEAVRSAYLGG